MNERNASNLSALRWAIAIALAGALAGCHSRSEDYQTLRDLPPDEWVAFASALPVERRLDLYVEVQGSNHNPPHTITEAFNQEPLRTYRTLVERIRAGDTSRYYQGVFYEIDSSPAFSICDQPDRQIVQEYLWEIATNAVRPEHRPDFYRC